MRYLITGANGMLGRDLQHALQDREVLALGRDELDIRDEAAVGAACVDIDVIINAAAYTRVDDAETHEDAAYAVNATGARNLAAAAARSGARMVQLSTDYVFDGSAASPYREDAPLNPISAYGRTKAAGEAFVRDLLPDRGLVVRTAWLYGANGPNFARTMLSLAASRPTWAVVDDQQGQPTWTGDLARKIVELIDSDVPAGTYHGTNAGQTTWFEFARAVLETVGEDPERITATDSSAFVRPAPRPAYSVLGHEAWAAVGIEPMRSWRTALEDAARHGVLRPA
ncbi:MAG: dTDP-4-dehydrorhamnose reductase [Agromyces sp.]